ncbi:MAG: GDP-mannose 4,6-dehydratase [Candidatus Omnitrophica bacterium]|nr:GDP-mannose 4,6-dehydratase [Candidatus Omnitrophota bacterium]
MKRVLISGVAGLIGSHLADRMLARGYYIVGVDDLSAGRRGNIRQALKNKRFTFKRADVSDAAKLGRALRGKRFDIVVHLAASKKIGEAGSSLKVLKNNYDSTVNMLEIARRNRAKFVFASTSDVYGVSKDLPFREDGDLLIGPSYIKRWSYAVSKLHGEHLAFAYSKEYGIPVVVIRYFGCFSSRSNHGPSGGHVPLFIRQALDGDTIVIHGDGRQTRSMGSVDDVARCTLLAIENRKAAGQIINIGTDEEISVKDSARIIVDAAKRFSAKAVKARIRHIPMKKVFGDYKEISRRIPDLSKAKKLFGYKPAISFKKAVEKAAREMAR